MQPLLLLQRLRRYFLANRVSWNVVSLILQKALVWCLKGGHHVKHVLPRKSVLCRSVRLYCRGVHLQHFLFDIAHLILNVIHTVAVGMAAELCSLALHELIGLSALNSVYLTQNIAAENLHLTGLGRHAHVWRRLSLCRWGAAAFRAVVLSAAVHDFFS